MAEKPESKSESKSESKYTVRTHPTVENGVIECDPDATSISELKKKCGGVIKQNITGHRWYWVQIKTDSINLDDLAPDAKLKASGILPSGTVLIVAPAKYRPRPGAAVASSGAGAGDVTDGLTPDKAVQRLGTEAKSPRQTAILEWVDSNAEEVLKCPAFLKAPNKTLQLILSRDTLGVEEPMVLEALQKVAKARGAASPDAVKKTLGDLLKLVRFPVMTPKQCASHVVTSGLLDQKQTLDLFTYVAQRESKGDSVTLPESLSAFPIKERAFANLESQFMYPPSQNWTPGVKTANCTGGPSNIVSNTLVTKGSLSWKIRVTGTNDFCIGIIPSGSESNNYYLWNQGTIGFRNSSVYGSTLPQRSIMDQWIQVTLDMNRKCVIYRFADKSTVTQPISSPAAAYRLGATLNSPGVITLE
jgi:hypothetical protein